MILDPYFSYFLEITEQTREAIANWIDCENLNNGDYLFKSRIHNSPLVITLCTRIIIFNTSLSLCITCIKIVYPCEIAWWP